MVNKKQNKKKKKSPIWEMKKTFNPALKLETLNAQCWIKRKDMKLISSQKKNSTYRSKAEK